MKEKLQTMENLEKEGKQLKERRQMSVWNEAGKRVYEMKQANVKKKKKEKKTGKWKE